MLHSTIKHYSKTVLSLGVLAAMSGNIQAAALEEVIVTAQKREQSLQEVPMAVSTLTTDQIEKSGVLIATDIATIVPNLNVATPHAQAAPNFSMRGISVANEYSYNQASPIGIYVNEVYQTARYGHGMSLFDMERVEVLRGPQGTLYGRNTTGGAINFITRDPSLDGESHAYVTAGVGNYSSVAGEAAGEVTLSENFGIRGAVKYNKSDDYMENVNPDGADGQGDDTTSARLSMRYSSDNLDVVLRGSYGNSEPGGTGVIALGSSGADGITNALSFYSRNADPDNAGSSLSDDEFNSNRTQDVEIEYKAASLQVKWDINDDWALTSITSYDEGFIDQSEFDWSASPVAMGWGDWLTEHDQIQQDMRLSYTFERGNLILGAYYGEDTFEVNNFLHFYEELLPLDAFASLGVVPIVATNNYEQKRESKAVYAHGSYDITDRLTITAGYRYTEDDFEIDTYGLLTYNVPDTLINFTGIGGGGATVATSDFFTALAGIDPDNENLWLGGIAGIPDFMLETVASAPGTPLNSKGDSSKPTGTIIVDYKFSDDIMGYFSASRGYRAGAINGQTYLSPAQVTFVQPEILDAFEVGLKTRLMDDRVQLNIAGFIYDYKDNQLVNIVGITGFLENAASSEIEGIEVELAAVVSDDLTINVNAGYQDAKYKDLMLQAGPDILDLSGNRMMAVPKVNLSLNADWRIYSGDAGSLSFVPTAVYTGHQYFSPFNKEAGNQRLEQDSYWLLNAQLIWDAEDYTVRLWGRNIQDETYMVYGIDIRSGFDVDYFMRGAPRSYGVDFSYRF